MAAQEALDGTAMSTSGPKERVQLPNEVYEHNNKCWALEVIGQDWSSDVLALFLEDWEQLARVALGCHVAFDQLSQEMKEACQVPTVTVYGSLSHLGREVADRRGVW